MTLGKSMKSTLYTGVSVLCWCRGTKLRCTDTDSEFMNKYTTLNNTYYLLARRFDPELLTACTQGTKTSGSKHPASEHY